MRSLLAVEKLSLLYKKSRALGAAVVAQPSWLWGQWASCPLKISAHGKADPAGSALVVGVA